LVDNELNQFHIFDQLDHQFYNNIFDFLDQFDLELHELHHEHIFDKFNDIIHKFHDEDHNIVHEFHYKDDDLLYELIDHEYKFDDFVDNIDELYYEDYNFVYVVHYKDHDLLNNAGHDLVDDVDILYVIDNQHFELHKLDVFNEFHYEDHDFVHELHDLHELHDFFYEFDHEFDHSL
jgi:hypothetical protein